MSGRTETVGIRALASGGAGVGELADGRVVFVERTAPGDEGEVEVLKEKSTWAKARLVRLDEAGPGRVDAPCPLYDRCGGCAVQHLAYEEQLRWKGRWVLDALERIGGLEGVEEPEVVPSPRELHYRDRLSFTLKRLRSGRVVAGFHELYDPHRVLDVHDECLLAEPPVVETWASLRDAWDGGARRLPDGGRLRLTLRKVAEDGVALLVEGGDAGWGGGGLLEDVPGLVDVWHHPADADEAVRVDGPAGPGPEDGVRPGAFTQVNAEVAPWLRDHVVDQLDGDGPVVDAYCGVGLYGHRLAEAGRPVTGIELDPAAAASARRGAPEGFTLVEGAVEDRLAEALPAEALILNPPRTGLHDDLPELLRERGPDRVVYVSCDAATLARDLKRLGDAYTLVGLRSFDLFPQTAHVETVAVLERAETP